MSWVMVTMDQVVNKAKIDWIYLRKIVLGTIRRGQFLYILLEVGYKYSFDCYSVSFLIPQSPSSGSSFYFILFSSFPFYPSCVRQIVGIDPCPISTFLKSLVVVVRLKITV